MGTPLNPHVEWKDDYYRWRKEHWQECQMPYDFSKFPQMIKSGEEEAPPKLPAPTYDI